MREAIIVALDKAKIPYKKVGKVRIYKNNNARDRVNNKFITTAEVKVHMDEENYRKAEGIVLRELEKVTKRSNLNPMKIAQGEGYNTKEYPGYFLATISMCND